MKFFYTRLPDWDPSKTWHWDGFMLWSNLPLYVWWNQSIALPWKTKTCTVNMTPLAVVTLTISLVFWNKIICQRLFPISAQKYPYLRGTEICLSVGWYLTHPYDDDVHKTCYLRRFLILKNTHNRICHNKFWISGIKFLYAV